ncbi:epoxide hydrolase N-terminal domain-containing protein [Nonomuraea rubra]|uniref:epoxide hydrolase N-terminal domain-containing protein n=1 Tax=Nonomuraea rubra TaxID=46180 RepID=UPI003CD09708
MVAGCPAGLPARVVPVLADEYDWRATERRLNSLPTVPHLHRRPRIHFLHVRSPHENALPLVLTPRMAGLDRGVPQSDRTAHRPGRLRRRRRDALFQSSAHPCPERLQTNGPAGAWGVRRIAGADHVYGPPRVRGDRYARLGSDLGARPSPTPSSVLHGTPAHDVARASTSSAAGRVLPATW